MAEKAGGGRNGAWLDKLDGDEAAMVAAEYARMREAMALAQTQRSLAEALARRDALAKDSPWLELEVVEGADYNVEGECGLWSFKTHRVVEKGTGRVLHDTRSGLPKQRGKQRHRTRGALMLALFLGLSKQSARDASGLLNHVYHQDGAVAATTVRDMAEAEGGRVGDSLSRAAELALALAAPPAPEAPPPPAPDSVARAFAEADIPKELLAEALANPVPLSDPGRTVNVAPDAVFCKKQKESRKPGASPAKGARKTVSACCASVTFDGAGISLAAGGYEALSRIVVACLLANRLAAECCCLLTDGEQKLKDVFQAALPAATALLVHILDWHHLDKRCSQLLSLALRGKEVRNVHRKALLALLWHGCADSAIAYLEAIPEADVKSPKHIQELVEYLRKRKAQIPVYSVRKALGLANSSNRVEKANDLLVSARQKGKGMSWSQEGSLALAYLRMVAVNRQQGLWLSEGEVSLELRRLAA